MKYATYGLLTLCLLAWCAGGVGASVNGFPGDEAAGVNTRTGNASPVAGFSTNETNSRIDDYIYQDEQINLTEKSGVVKVLRVNQKNLVNDYVVDVIPFENPEGINTVTELLYVFRNIVGKEGGRAEAIRDKVKKQGFIQVICPEFQLQYIRDAVKALDQAWVKDGADGFVTVAYKAKHRNAQDMDDVITNPAGGMATNMGGGDGTTRLDLYNNTLIRRTEPWRAGEYKKAFEQLDIPPLQMEIEAVIYEVNKSDDLKLGLDYIAWKNGPGRNLFDFVYGGAAGWERFKNVSSIWSPLAQRTALDGIHEVSSRAAQYYGYANALITSAYVDFLVCRGNARVVCKGKITCGRSGSLGTLSTTGQVLGLVSRPNNVTRTSVDGSDNGVDNRTLNQVVETDAAGVPVTTGVELAVRPYIGTLSSEVEVSAVFKTLAGTSPQGQSIINSRTINTVVRLKDGSPLVIGGIKREEKLERTAGIPGIGELPLLKYIFGGKTDTDRMTDFVIVLTPKVIVGAQSDLQEAQDVETRAIVRGEKPLELPSMPWGYDQWLLDAGKTTWY